MLHFADLHLGVETGGRPNPATGLNQRIHDVCDRLDEVCAAVEEEGVHAVVFAGDAFKNQHPTPTLQSLFAARIRRMARAGAAVFLLVGNHDLPKMAGLAHPFSIYPALEVAGVVVGDRARVYPLPLREGAPAQVLQVGALPHFSRHQVRSRVEGLTDADIDRLVADTVRTLDEGVDRSAPALFAGHCHLSKAAVGEGQSLFGVSEVEVSLSTLASSEAFACYLLGHVHARQVLSEDPFVAYSGSLERVDFGEGDTIDVPASGEPTRRRAEEKGFYLIDLEAADGVWRVAEASFRPVSSREFITLRLGELDHADPAADLAERVSRARAAGAAFDGAFVRVTGSVQGADRGRITTGLIGELFDGAYDVRIALTATEDATVRDPRFASRMNEVEALERYLETREDWKDDRAALLELGRELVAEVLQS